MKLNKYFMLGLAGLAFAACNNDNDVAITDDGNNKTLIVSIAGIGSSTRATTPGDAWSADANATAAITNINNLTLFFTDANGAVKYTYKAQRPVAEGETEDTNLGKSDLWTSLTGSGVKFIGLKEVTAVHAVANKNADLGTVTDVNDLSTEFAKQGLSIAKEGGVIYVGSETSITPLFSEPATGVDSEYKFDENAESANFYYQADIVLKPIISRIQITGIEVVSSGSTTFGPADDTDKYTLTWEGFTPTLNAIYLNNFGAQFNDFAGTVTTPIKNTSYVGLLDGTWKVNNTDYAADAAYISYANGAFGSLLTYGTETDGVTPMTIDEGKCIAFNVFVPFTVNATADEMADADGGEIANPTIHFQFAKNVTGYKTTPSLTDGGTLTDADKTYIATADPNLDYTLPVVDNYLFANISKLYSDVQGTTELAIKPGYIYNMKVQISPVNMTVDLDNPESYNVVVLMEVLPFNEINIYPGLD